MASTGARSARPAGGGRCGAGTARDESFAALPDLVIIDGGKGQLSAVLDVMREMGVKDIPAVGLAKQHEEIYVQDVSEPVVLPRTSQALYLVQRIRDEAHRFAITYHRGVRKKVGFQSALDTIPGRGAKAAEGAAEEVRSVRGIREASVEEMATTVGFHGDAGGESEGGALRLHWGRADSLDRTCTSDHERRVARLLRAGTAGDDRARCGAMCETIVSSRRWRR